MCSEVCSMPCITKSLESLEMLGDGGMRGSGKTTLCSVLQKVGAPDPLKHVETRTNEEVALAEDLVHAACLGHLQQREHVVQVIGGEHIHFDEITKTWPSQRRAFQSSSSNSGKICWKLSTGNIMKTRRSGIVEVGLSMPNGSPVHWAASSSGDSSDSGWISPSSRFFEESLDQKFISYKERKAIQRLRALEGEPAPFTFFIICPGWLCWLLPRLGLSGTSPQEVADESEACSATHDTM